MDKLRRISTRGLFAYVTTLALSDKDLLYCRGMDGKIDQLFSLTQFGDLVEGARKLAIEEYFSSKDSQIIAFREQTQQGLSQKDLEDCVRLHDFSRIDHASEEFERLYRAVAFKETIARGMIRRVVGGKNTLGFNNAEIAVILANLDTLQIYDDYFLAWNRIVVASPLAKKFKELGADKALEMLKKDGLINGSFGDFWYSVFEEKNGKIVATAYFEAFQEVYRKEADIIDGLLTQLSATPPSPQTTSLITYYTALLEALKNTDILRVENLWSGVDKAWLGIVGRIVPTHAMEVYADPLGKLVEPEHRLAVLDERPAATKTNELNLQTKDHVVGLLEERYSDKNSTHYLLPTLKKSLAQMYLELGSGITLTFRPAASNLVNRADLRLLGVRILEDTETFTQRFEIQKKLLITWLGSNYVKKIFSDEEAINSLQAGVFVAGHEYGHNAFIDQDTHAKLGGKLYSNIEEHKSDFVSLSASYNNLSKNNLPLLVKGLLAGEIRSLARRNDDSSRPYWNSAVAILSIMLEVEIIKHNDTWELDFAEEKIEKFFQQVLLLTDKLANIYDSKSPEKAQEYMNTYFAETPTIVSLEKALGVAFSS